MRKEIEIGGKRMVITSSAYTMFAYTNMFQGNLLEDLSDMEELISGMEQMESGQQVKMLQPILEKLLYMAYVMNAEADNNVPPFKEWCKGIKSMFKDRRWIQEVMEVASNAFLGQAEETEQSGE